MSDSQLTVQGEPDPPSLLNFIALAVHDPQIDVTKLQALLDMQKQVVADEAKRVFQVALHSAQREMPRVSKLGTIDTGKGIMKFARWQDVDTVLRPVMERHGFALSFTSAPREGGGAMVKATLQHLLGHEMTAEMSLPLDTGPGRNNLQALGSTLSYGKRYLAEMLFNIVRADEDNDGAGHTGAFYLTDAEIGELNGLMKETKTDPKRFEAFVGMPLDKVEGKRFIELKTLLQAKRKKG